MILVTGATGLVGGHLIWHLLQENERVSATHRKNSKLDSIRTIFWFYTKYPDEFLDKIDWIEVEILDEKSVAMALQNASVVYHCAAVVSLGSNDSKMMETNVSGTRNIVKACLLNGVEKLCFVSSIAACGKSEDQRFIDEKSVWVDSFWQSAYSRSKYYSEQEVWNGIKQGLKAVIVNPGVILGVSGTETGSSELFARVQKGLIFYTNGGSGYIDVQDVAKIMIQLVKSETTAERFVLVSENCSNRKVLSLMAKGFNKQKPIIGIGKRMLVGIGFLSETIGKIFRFKPLIDRGKARSVTNRAYFSSEKVKKLLDYKFKPIEECISEVCRFRLRL